MKRRSLRLAAMLAGVLACSLVATTSSALYLASMGPVQCCKSHCGHAMPARDAKRCCQKHLTVAPAAVGNGKTVPVDVGAMSTPAALIPTHLPLAAIVATSPGGELRAPPGGSLLGQHTSLAL